MSIQKYIPIQIIGTQRSGSNLFRLMLNEVKGVIAPHPPHILKTFMPLLSNYSDLNETDNFRQLIVDVADLIRTNPVVWENIKLDTEEIFSRCENRTLVEVFRVVHDLMAEANQATHWCCKSMANVKFAIALEANGMNTKYIRLVRDGRDVAASFKKVAVGEKHAYHLAKYWKELQVLSSDLVSKLDDERALTIKYEELICQPEHTMKSVCQFLELPYANEILQYFESSASRHTAASGFMWQNVRKPILKDNKQKYKTALTPTELQIFEAVAGDTLKANGYSLETSPSGKRFTTQEIAQFDLENDRLKRNILDQAHLKTDLSKRKAQEALMTSIKARKQLEPLSLV